MSITTWMQGDTAPAWKFLLTLDSGIFDVSGLSPSNFSLILHNTSSNQEVVGQGTFFNLQVGSESENVPPSISYSIDPEDVATIGINRAYILVTYGSGAKQTFSLDYLNIGGH